MRRLIKEECYVALSRNDPRGVNRFQLLLVRRDTFELMHVETVSVESIDKLTEVASIRLAKFDRPVDWDAPHRKCIAYYLKMRRKQEKFFELSQKTITAPDIAKIIYKNDGYLFHLLRKINFLSHAERLSLLKLSPEELLPERKTRVLDLIYARVSLFWMFFSKTSAIVMAYNALANLINDELLMPDEKIPTYSLI